MQKPIDQNSIVKIDLSALRHNAEVLRSYLQSDTRQLAVVKADAYGHGAVEVAKALRDRVDWFAVNDVEEGIELREAGIALPILVFGVPTEHTSPVYRNFNLTATVSAPEHVDILKPQTDYHINFDTGMRRLGILPEQIPEVKDKMSGRSDLNCTGIYSHFATAEEPDSGKASEQLKRFEALLKDFDDKPIRHMGNTGGAAFYPDAHFDMVRTGIGLYGYAPGKTAIEGLEPVLRWKSRLAQVKPIQKGDTVSYGAQWECDSDGYIGIVPAGYEEGIPKTLSGRLKVAVNGRLYPVVGAVTMNYIIVYFGNESVRVGQDVDILGGSAMKADRWADEIGTIPYEILTGISPRVPRKYI